MHGTGSRNFVVSITVCLVLMLVVNVSHCPYHCLPPCPHCPAGFQHLFKRTPNIKGRQDLKEYKPSTISYTGLCVYSPSSRCLGRRTRSWCTHRGLPLKLKGLAPQAPNIQHRPGEGPNTGGPRKKKGRRIFRRYSNLVTTEQLIKGNRHRDRGRGEDRKSAPKVAS